MLSRRQLYALIFQLSEAGLTKTQIEHVLVEAQKAMAMDEITGNVIRAIDSILR